MYNDWSNLELGRAKRAKELELINVNDACTSAECIGSGGEVYVIEDMNCSCPDHMMRGCVCKHMIAIAAMRGDIDIDEVIAEATLRKKISDCKAELARAYGYYYMFNDPVIGDAEYDKLKKKLDKLVKQYNDR